MSLIPLESNPDVMNKFLVNLGVPDIWQITDVYGLDEDALAIVPRPLISVILLFPTSSKYEDHCSKENLNIEAKGQKISPSVYYMKQYLHNACGTVALIHSIANNLDQIDLKDGCLKEFLESSKHLAPEEKGKFLQTHQGIIDAHAAIACEGQTRPPPPDEELQHHFIAFVCKDGRLYELDGIRPFPIVHGPSTAETLLEDAASVIRGFIERDPENLGFTVMAFSLAFD